ncbi:MAG: hypothetical protein LBJ64_04300 [Deltaproteobacteria bacterium]|jgi:hypothetical protein|nr:hypothetical protein [Deltaproteobacteria bacterium]
MTDAKKHDPGQADSSDLFEIASLGLDQTCLSHIRGYIDGYVEGYSDACCQSSPADFAEGFRESFAESFRRNYCRSYAESDEATKRKVAVKMLENGESLKRISELTGLS